MKDLRRLAQQGLLAVTASIIAVSALLPTLFSATASAAQVASRSITMSSSAAGATGVSYTVSFTAGTTTTNPDLIVDFCSNDPLIGDSCTATAGTDVPNMSSAAVSGMTVATIGSNRGVKITGTSTYTAGSTYSFTITGVTNPSNTAAFYARIIVYANGGAGSNTSSSPGTYVDYGGIALSTVANINITAKVFETLTFCVFNTACGTAPSLILGDPTTGALSTSSAYATNETGSNSAQYTLATNAGGGVAVVMRGTTLCRSATPSNCNTGTASAYTITSIGSSAAAKSTGTEQFGMCADTTAATGGLAAQVPYSDTVNNCHGQTTTSNVYSGTSQFGFNDSTSAGGTNNTSGSKVLQSTGAVSSYTGSFMFLADIANTTEAGLYTTSLNMVATSTF